MRYELVLAPAAVRDLRVLSAHVRSQVRDALERHLRHEPMHVSRSRIKRLRGLRQPQYRLRVGDIRVFYDVTPSSVEVLAIITKARVDAWLAAEGVAADPSAPGEGEG